MPHPESRPAGSHRPSGRPRSLRHLVLAAVAALLLGLVGGTAPALGADADLEQAQREQQEAAQRLRDAQAEEQRITAELDQVVQRLADAEAEEGRTSARLAEAEEQVAAARERVEVLAAIADDRIRAAYTSGSGTDLLAVMISSDNPDAALDRLALLGVVARSDEEILRAASEAQAEFEAAQAVARQLRADAARQREEVVAEQAHVNQLLGQAQEARAAQEAALQEATAEVIAETQRVAEEEAARRAAAAAAAAASAYDDGGAGAAVAQQIATRGGFACLVGPVHNYTDTFGAPRSGGRSHQGVDVFAPYGSGVYAVESGTVTRSYNNSLGGLAIWLQGDSGNSYYYAHQSRNIATAGQRVNAGDLIGHVGTSGNAAGTSPHVHFEVHPGGGRAVNPTPFTRTVCS